MPIVTPGKRPGVRLAQSKVFGKKGGFAKKRSGYATLMLTPMVDMFIIIVIYLLQNFSSDGDILFMSKDIQLPSITSKIQLERAPVVAISRDSLSGDEASGFISVDGTRVLDVSDVLQDDVWNIPALEEVMREKRRNIEQSAQLLGGAGFKGLVNIQADRGIPFKVLKKVMFACNQAGFSQLSFAGVQVSAPGEAPQAAAH